MIGEDPITLKIPEFYLVKIKKEKGFGIFLFPISFDRVGLQLLSLRGELELAHQDSSVD